MWDFPRNHKNLYEISQKTVSIFRSTRVRIKNEHSWKLSKTLRKNQLSGNRKKKSRRESAEKNWFWPCSLGKVSKIWSAAGAALGKKAGKSSAAGAGALKFTRSPNKKDASLGVWGVHGRVSLNQSRFSQIESTWIGHTDLLPHHFNVPCWRPLTTQGHLKWTLQRPLHARLSGKCCRM